MNLYRKINDYCIQCLKIFIRLMGECYFHFHSPTLISIALWQVDNYLQQACKPVFHRPLACVVTFCPEIYKTLIIVLASFFCTLCMIKKSFSLRSFSYTGPVIWNKLPYDIRNSQSKISFKKPLKTHLFAMCYWMQWILCFFCPVCHTCYSSLFVTPF